MLAKTVTLSILVGTSKDIEYPGGYYKKTVTPSTLFGTSKDTEYRQWWVLTSKDRDIVYPVR